MFKKYHEKTVYQDSDKQRIKHSFRNNSDYLFKEIFN